MVPRSGDNWPPMHDFLRHQLHRYTDRLAELDFLLTRQDIMADMGWMAEYHQPDIGILSAGGHYTMDMARAAFAARKYFNFSTVIPCHYRTFPILAQDATELRAGLPPNVRVIEPEVLEPIEI